ncbi:MAG TPA: peptide ABC transporter substrate-binding protein, partial [Thermomicrobiales bacterium]|nr:peptide ABC transporter substrate-binding protein [Thermomicrobiales bacterium]
AIVGGSLLAACGGDDDDDDDGGETPAASGETPAAGGGATATTASSGGSSSPSTGSPEAEATSSGGSAPVGMTPVAELADEQVMRLPSGEPNTMDPGVSFGGDELDIMFNIFDGVTGVDQQTGEIVPRVAETYEGNADGSEYTFNLRTGLQWSDGTPMNANDFVYSWKRVLDPNTKSQYMPALYSIKGAQEAAESGAGFEDIGVEAVDDNTLKVTLVGPTPYFPLLTTTWTFYPVPKHIIDDKGDAWVEAENIVSNGPFILTSWDHNQEMILEQNPNFYGDTPTLTRAEYRLFDDPVSQAYVSFENDELDYAQVTGADVDRAMGDADASKNLLTFSLSNCNFVVCDTSNPPTDQKPFRQALSMAISRETLTGQVLKGQFDPAYTILAPDIKGNNPDASIGEDVDKAKSLLTDAGIDDPGSVEIELVYISTPARNKTVAEYLQATWNKNLGIEVKLTPIESTAYSDWRASRETQKYNTYTGSWGSDFSDASNWFNQNFTHAADHYRNHYNNPDFDSLVEEAAVNTDEAEREQQYKDAEVIIVDDAPIIPLYRSKAFRAIKPYVKNLFLQPILSVVHLRTVQIEKH